MWIKLCDQTIHHRKFRKAAELLGGKEAFSRVLTCWFAGMNYANFHKTGGFLPTEEWYRDQKRKDACKNVPAARHRHPAEQSTLPSTVKASLWPPSTAGWTVSSYLPE